MLKKNKFSILVALCILYLSLTSSETFDEVPVFGIENIDKVAHFGMYFGLMAVIILENRKNLTRTSQLFFIGLIPLSYSILMEFLQLSLTTSRSGSFYDVLFNLAGILCSIILWMSVKPLIKNRLI